MGADYPPRWVIIARRFTIWILADPDNVPVPSVDIMLAIWGDANSANKLKKLIEPLRDRIVTEWFGIDDAELGKRVGESVLLNVARRGYILNASVVIES